MLRFQWRTWKSSETSSDYTGFTHPHHTQTHTNSRCVIQMFGWSDMFLFLIHLFFPDIFLLSNSSFKWLFMSLTVYLSAVNNAQPVTRADFSVCLCYGKWGWGVRVELTSLGCEILSLCSHFQSHACVNILREFQSKVKLRWGDTEQVVRGLKAGAAVPTRIWYKFSEREEECFA